MSGSRHLRGTITSRVQNLLRCGAYTRRPIWLDIVEKFPPFVPTKINRFAVLKGKMEKLSFPDDTITKKFYERCYNPEPMNLFENKETSCSRFVKECHLLIQSGHSEDEAFEMTVNSFQRQGMEFKSKPQETIKKDKDYIERIKLTQPHVVKVYKKDFDF